MTAAVFDTNVIVSAVLSPSGAPGRLLDAMLDGFCQPVVSDAILAEYEEVLNRPKFRFPAFRVHALLDAIRACSIHAPFVLLPNSEALPDPDDVIFVEAAAGAHVPIVTGNIRHYPRVVREGISVLSPSEFLIQLTREQ